MEFDSLQYLLLMAALLAVVSRMGGRPGLKLPGLMLLASLVFYAFAGWFALGLFVLSILFNQGLMERIAPASLRRRRLLLGLGLAYNLAYLFAFKYAAFMQQAWGGLGQALGLWAGPQHLLAVALPVGISFYTFESLSILTDVYKGAYPPPDLLDHALFVSFFPHLVAGPIMRGKELLPQVRAMRERRPPALWSRGIAFIVQGLFKKAALADLLALYVNPVFKEPAAFGAQRLWLAAAAFAFQIYFDFSGYSDMAEGSAALLGLRLTRNFKGPYLSVTLTEFWRRWHVSLSSWLRDYLYIPLGGSRHGWARTYAALAGTMLLGGLWHGANLTFVAWGGLHGAGLALERATGSASAPAGWWGQQGRRAMTLLYVGLGWVLFRCRSIGDAAAYFRQLARGAYAWDPVDGAVLLLIGASAAFSRWNSRWEDGAWAAASEDRLAPMPAALMLGAIVILKVSLSSLGQPFIYFRF